MGGALRHAVKEGGKMQAVHQRVTATFTAPAASCRIAFRMSGCTGTAYLDDLQLEQAEAALLGFAPQEPAQLLHLGRVLEIYCSWEIPAEHGSEKGLYQYCMERARALNLVPEPVMFRRVFCYTKKGGTKQVHNVLRVPVKMAE